MRFSSGRARLAIGRLTRRPSSSVVNMAMRWFFSIAQASSGLPGSVIVVLLLVRLVIGIAVRSLLVLAYRLGILPGGDCGIDIEDEVLIDPVDVAVGWGGRRLGHGVRLPSPGQPRARR